MLKSFKSAASLVTAGVFAVGTMYSAQAAVIDDIQLLQDDPASVSASVVPQGPERCDLDCAADVLEVSALLVEYFMRYRSGGGERIKNARETALNVDPVMDGWRMLERPPIVMELSAG